MLQAGNQILDTKLPCHYGVYGITYSATTKTVPAALPLTSAAFVSQTPLRLQSKTAWLTRFTMHREVCKASRVSRTCAAGQKGSEMALRLCPRLVYNHPYRLRKPRSLDSQDTGRDYSVKHEVLDPCHFKRAVTAQSTVNNSTGYACVSYTRPRIEHRFASYTVCR